jgi:hypothetical protein
MRILLQNKDRQYLKDDGTWGETITEAQNFGSTAAAVYIALALRVHDGEIVYDFSKDYGNTNFNFQTPLLPSRENRSVNGSP